MYVHIRCTYTYVYVHIHMYMYEDTYIMQYHATEKVYTQQQCIMQYTWINIHIHLCMYIMYILALESQIKAQS